MIGFFAFIITVVMGILVLVAGLQWIQGQGRRVEKPGQWPGQLDRIETALGALESRVDELQAQQRFLERLLAERPERPERPEPPRLEPGAPPDEEEER